MQKTTLVVMFIVAIAVIAGGLFYVAGTKDTPPPQTSTITSFEECVEAGNAVMESYPPQCRTDDGQTFTQNIGNELELRDMIRITSPRPGTAIENPLSVEGEARGPWYFEASFSARLTDANGAVLAEVPVTADGEWMTEEFVPYSATFIFAAPQTPTGTLLLQKANPSGLPEHAGELRVPVRFYEDNEQAINVYWATEESGQTTCAETAPSTRVIAQTPAVARAALTELLRGPQSSETNLGFSTALPEGDIEIQELRVENGVAYVDFNQALQTGVGGSCRVTQIRAQVEDTLLQFPTVSSVVISIDGETETVLQP